MTDISATAVAARESARVSGKFGDQKGINPPEGALTSAPVTETAEEIEERFANDYADTTKLVDEAVQNGFLTAAPTMNGVRRYTTGDILIGRGQDGDQLYVNMHVEEVLRDRVTTDDPSVAVDRIWDISYTGTHQEKGQRYAYASGGQIHDTLASFKPSGSSFTADDTAELSALWKSGHLNTMQAGTVEQTAIVRAARAEEPDRFRRDDYQSSLMTLAEHGLQPDRGYNYGSAWLAKSVPPVDIERSLELLARGKRRE